MLHKLDFSPVQLVWLLLGASTSIWFAIVTGTQLEHVVMAAPFTLLGLPFWLGLVLAGLAFFIGSPGQRVAAIVILACYFIATLAFIYPHAVMHDSLANALQFPNSTGENELYSNTYIGFGSAISWLEEVGDLGPWGIARFFPVGMGLLYLFSIGLILVSWRDRIFSSQLSCALFAFFFFVFGNAFYLRINASPQSMGFLMFLIALGLIPLASRSILLKVALLLALSVMIISHPITPLLAVPGLIVAGAASGEWTSKQILRSLQLVGTFLIGYGAWLLYKADWILTRAVNVINDALNSGKQIPILSSAPLGEIADYVLLNRIFLVALMATLVVGYLILWRSKPWYFVTAWGIVFSPAFVVFLSYRDFFDRIMLFLLVPCAIIFAEAGAKLARSLPRLPMLRVSAVTYCLSLLMLSAAVSYFWVGAVDRITQDEVDGAHYLASLNRNLTVYANGFNVPVSANLKFIPANRGVLQLEQIKGADAVVISQQVENAVMLGGHSPLTLDEFRALLDRDFQITYSSGNTYVYLRKSISKLEKPNGR